MKIYVAAEFDSADLADLASGRVRNINGLISTEVLRNRLDGSIDDDDDDGIIMPMASPAGSMAYMSGYSASNPFYITSFDGSNKDSFEPSERRDALLRAEVVSDSAAQQVSSVLRGIGGRNIKIIHR